MKKLLTLFLLVLLGYNSIGYYIGYHIQQFFAQKEITASIDRGEFVEEDLTIFKLPLQEYYEQTSQDFDRVEGDFVYHGNFYEKVKERIEEDTIYIYCIKDHKQEQLYQELTDYLHDNFLDVKSNAKEKPNKLFKQLLKEYLPKSPTLIAVNTYSIKDNEFNKDCNVSYLQIVQNIPSPPPRLG